MDPVVGKAAMRASLLARRRDRSEDERRVARAFVDRHLRAAVRGHRTIALFLPLPTEPLGGGTVDQLSRTHSVLLPRAGVDRPLDWAQAGGGVRRSPFGIDEPDGPARGPDAVLTADLVLVPALAVDRAGRRLGRGGGHYDRTLALLTGRADRPMLLAVVFDDEVLDEVPVVSTDERVDAVLTPSGGVVRLPRGRTSGPG